MQKANLVNNLYHQQKINSSKGKMKKKWLRPETEISEIFTCAPKPLNGQTPALGLYKQAKIYKIL